MKKTSLMFALFLSLLLLVSMNMSTAMADNNITIKVGSYEPEQHYLVQYVYVPYTKEIERRTNGKVKFKWYHGASLVKANQTYDALKGGLVDMVPTLAVWTMESQFPISRGLTLPFMFESTVQVDKAYKKAYETIPELRNEYKGIKLLGFHGTDFMNLHLVTKAPKTVADMKGLKLWAPSKTLVELVKLLDATPRSIKTEDLYMSLQRKAIDGAIFPTAPLAKWKLTDMCDNHTIFSSTFMLIPMAMSEKTWNSLPPDVQKVFNEMSPSLTEFCGAIVDDRRGYIIKALQKRGDTINFIRGAELEEWKSKVYVMYDRWFKLMESKGLDGKAILKKIQALAKEFQGAKHEEPAWWGNEWRK